jgi:hypothetical protein
MPLIWNKRPTLLAFSQENIEDVLSLKAQHHIAPSAKIREGVNSKPQTKNELPLCVAQGEFFAPHAGFLSAQARQA